MNRLELIKKKSGISLIEVIIALAVLGIVSAPVSMLFIHNMKVTKMSDYQIELNAVTRIVSQNVRDAIKGKAIHGTMVYLTDDGTVYYGTPADPRNNLEVYDHNGKKYSNYEFDAVYNGTLEGKDYLIAYKIILRKRNQITNTFEEIRRFIVEANKLNN